MLEIRNDFNPKNDLNGLSLAFLGDGVYELLVREYLLKKGSMPVGKLHTLAVSYVKASAQAKAIEIIETNLSEEEHNIFLRGRNCSSTHVPKGASPKEYRLATGFESLFGWLYLKNMNERLKELFEMSISAIEKL